MRIVEAADVPHLVAAYPERDSDAINRHTERFEGQQSGDVTCLAAWDERSPIGYLFVSWLGGRCQRTGKADELGCAEIGDLAVAAPARGQGIGRQLMAAAEDLIRARGLKLVGLAVAARNPKQAAARALYGSMEYKDAGYGEFASGYTYRDAEGNLHLDENRYVYLVKNLTRR